MNATSSFRCRGHRSLVLILALFCVPPALAGQSRYELGRRLREFESQWARDASGEARARALAPLSESVAAFLSLRLGQVAPKLGEALLAHEGRDDDARRWALSLAVTPEHRLVAAGTATLSVSLRSLYDPGVAIPAGALIHLQWFRESSSSEGETGEGGAAKDRKGERLRSAVGERVLVGFNGAPTTVAMPVPKALIGDAWLDVVVEAEQATSNESPRGATERLHHWTLRVSLVNDLNERLLAAKTALNAAATNDGDLLHLAIAKHLLALLTELTEVEALETEVPADRLLTEVEGLLQCLSKKSKWAVAKGDTWLALRAPKRSVPCRLYVPSGFDGTTPLPLVVALHGMGGSENLFFDGYGNGMIQDLAEARGMAVLSPRVVPSTRDRVAALIASLAEVMPVDRERVVVVGHSMGAAAALTAVRSEPSLYRAVAALGGGRRINAEGLGSVRFFVGVGDQDFALSGARGLHEGLKRGGVTSTLEIYEGIEHLMIVPTALPDVFRFFDEALSKPLKTR